METNFLENNSLTLVGKITDEKKFSHEIYGEKFYVFDLSVPRLSGNADIIPITISERLFKEDELVVGKKVKVLTAGETVGELNIVDLTSGTISENAEITPLKKKDVIITLTYLKTNLDKVEKNLKAIPKAINAIKGTVVKDSQAMKAVTTLSNAITTYVKSSGGMASGTIKAMSKHLKMYTKREAGTEA